MQNINKEILFASMNKRGMTLFLLAIAVCVFMGTREPDYWYGMAVLFAMAVEGTFSTRHVESLVIRKIKWSLKESFRQIIIAILLYFFFLLVFSIGYVMSHTNNLSMPNISISRMAPALALGICFVVFVIFQFNIQEIYSENQAKLGTKE